MVDGSGCVVDGSGSRSMVGGDGCTIGRRGSTVT